MATLIITTINMVSILLLAVSCRRMEKFAERKMREYKEDRDYLISLVKKLSSGSK